MNKLRKQIPRLSSWAGLACMVAGVLAWLIRCTVQDWIVPTALFYYVLPPLVAGPVMIVGAGLWNGPRAWRLPVFIAGLLSTGFGYNQGIIVNELNPETRSEVSALFWNSARANTHRPVVARYFDSSSFDLVGMVEYRGLNPLLKNPAFRDYQVYDAWSVRLAVRGEILQGERIQLKWGRGKVLKARVRIDSGELLVLVVDVESNPFYSKRPFLEEVYDIASDTNLPVVVMGDFNTPADSRWFRAWEQDFVNAFEVAGQGWTGTWPRPFNILRIDHVWTRGLSIHQSELVDLPGSDHRAVIARGRYSEGTRAPATPRRDQ